MGRGYDFVVVGVIYIIAIVIHVISVELVSPGTPLYAIATDGTAVMNGAARAELWYKILTVWVPLLAMGGITAWGFVREYRRQAITAAQRVRR